GFPNYLSESRPPSDGKDGICMRRAMLVASLFTVAAPLVASQVATGHSSAGAVKSPTADTVYVAGPEPGLAISVRGSRKFEPDETQLIAAVAPPVIDPAALAAGLPEGCSTSGQ